MVAHKQYQTPEECADRNLSTNQMNEIMISKHPGKPRGNKDPTAAEGVEIRSTAGSLQVHGTGVTTDQGGARGMREPARAVMLRVSGGTEGGRSNSSQ